MQKFACICAFLILLSSCQSVTKYQIGALEIDPALCGNTDGDPDEVCDDGNNVAGDGCRADCLGEELCGDGLFDPEAGEECDDGNVSNGDGCSSQCLIQALPACGDLTLDPGEVCDDGNSRGGDGCAGDCSAIDPGHFFDSLPQGAGGIPSPASAASGPILLHFVGNIAGGDFFKVLPQGPGGEGEIEVSFLGTAGGVCDVPLQVLFRQGPPLTSPIFKLPTQTGIGPCGVRRFPLSSDVIDFSAQAAGGNPYLVLVRFTGLD